MVNVYLLRTICRRMRQRPGVLDHLGKVADVEPVVAGRVLAFKQA